MFLIGSVSLLNGDLNCRRQKKRSLYRVYHLCVCVCVQSYQEGREKDYCEMRAFQIAWIFALFCISHVIYVHHIRQTSGNIKKKECFIHSRYIIPIAYLRLYKHTLRGEDILCTHITDRQQNKEWKGVYVTNTIKYTTFSWHHHSILLFIYLFFKERALPSFSREIELPCILVFNCVCSAYRTGDIFL